MVESAGVTSRGRVTIPARVREAVGIRPGVRLLFTVEADHVIDEEPIPGRHVLVQPYPDFFQLAGTVPVPQELRGVSWRDVRRTARLARRNENLF